MPSFKEHIELIVFVQFTHIKLSSSLQPQMKDPKKALHKTKWPLQNKKLLKFEVFSELF